MSLYGNVGAEAQSALPGWQHSHCQPGSAAGVSYPHIASQICAALAVQLVCMPCHPGLQVS